MANTRSIWPIQPNNGQYTVNMAQYRPVLAHTAQYPIPGYPPYPLPGTHHPIPRHPPPHTPPSTTPLALPDHRQWLTEAGHQATFGLKTRGHIDNPVAIFVSVVKSDNFRGGFHPDNQEMAVFDMFLAILTDIDRFWHFLHQHRENGYLGLGCGYMKHHENTENTVISTNPLTKRHWFETVLHFILTKPCFIDFLLI